MGLTSLEYPQLPSGMRVEIITGSFGAGHDAAAHEIARRLHGVGLETRVSDIVDLMPGWTGRLLRSLYLRQIQSVPRTWSWLLGGLSRHDSVATLVARLVGSTTRALLDLAADGPAWFVSTHPFASQALGRLRSDGRLAVPTATYLTDMSVHRLWVHAGIDVHLAMHELPGDEARALGARRVAVVSPAVPRPAQPAVPARRADFQLPADRPLVLVTGGSLGIGELAATARDIAATGRAVAVVLCGRNERLRRSLHGEPGIVALSWVDDIPDLLRCVDAVVQNAGGFTSLQTLAAGVPMASYRCIAGHGESNAAALDRAGLVRWLHCAEDLDHWLTTALERGADVAVPTSRLPSLDAPTIADVLVPAAEAVA
ncbi:MAG: galactosyldiacylglycerol synthase [Nocardioidaceae bacterium]|nr:galactosyldiacylglycerol synthase [Nocardioidaceae bacterium]